MTTTVVPELEAVANQYKLKLKALDAEVLSDLARRYTKVYITATRELHQLMEKIDAVNLVGAREVPVGWHYREQRLNELLRQLHSQVQEFANQTGTSLTAGQQQAINLAQQYAQAMTHASLGPTPAGVNFGAQWANVPQQAILNIAANTHSGPLADILQQIAPQAAAEARDVIVNGVAQGFNPRKVATLLHQQLGAPLARAQLIARTEILRAQREVSQKAFQENSQVVGGWTWQAALDDRTCDFCWALNGEHFDVEEGPDTHPNCRCTMIPDVTSYLDAGFGAEVAGAYRDVPGDVDELAPSIVADGGNVDLVNGTADMYFVAPSPVIRMLIERSGTMPADAKLLVRRPVPTGTEVVVPLKVPLYKMESPFQGEYTFFQANGMVPVRDYLTSGPAKFEQLSEARQLKILGPAKYRAYKDNKVVLRDFIGYKDNRVWGRTGYSKSLKEVLGKTEAAKYYGLSPSERAVREVQRQARIEARRVREQARQEARRQAQAQAQLQRAQRAATTTATRAQVAPPAPQPVEVLSQIESDLKNGTLRVIQDMSGEDHVNPAYKVHIDGDGDAVVKPRPNDVDTIERVHHPSIPPYQDPEREAAGSVMARLMGIDTPVVVTRDVETQSLGESSVQQWRDFNKFRGGGTPAEQRSIGLFDVVIGNLDRHAGQVGIQADGKLLPYDHGLAFPSWVVDTSRGYDYEWLRNDIFSRQFYNSPLRPDEVQLLEKLDTPEVRTALAATGLDQRAIDQMYHRISSMLTTGKFMSTETADKYGLTQDQIDFDVDEALNHYNDIAGDDYY